MEYKKAETFKEHRMIELKRLDYDFTVCKVKEIRAEDLEGELYFIGKSEEELSMVCLTSNVPADTIEREDGWKSFRIQGVLDFSLIGILAPITAILADNKIGIFAVSTYNTDYILVKREDFDAAMSTLAKSGYTIV